MDIRFEVQGLAEVRRELSRVSREIDRGRAMSMALNKVGRKAQTTADRAIRQRFAMPANEVRGAMALLTARRSQLEVTLSIFGSPSRRGRSMNMVHFLESRVSMAEARRRRKSDTLNKPRFRILKGGPLKTIDGAFIGNKGRTIFRRTGRSRLPIEPVQVIGVSQMFSTRTVRAQVIARIESELMVEVTRAVDLVISRR